MLRRFAVCCCVLACCAVAAAWAADKDEWPQWRGPLREGISNSKNLLREWPEEGPEVKWQVDHAGVGYSSVAVAGNRVFTQGDLFGVEHVIALSAEDGSVLWQVQPGQLGELLAARVEERLKQFDKDNDGELNEQEALVALGWDFNKHDRGADPDRLPQIAEDRAAQMVGAFDLNGDDKLDYSETEKIRGLDFRGIDQDDKDADVEAISERRSSEMLQLLDKDRDGKITRQEARGSLLQREFNRADQRDKQKDNQADGAITKAELLQYFGKFQGGRDGYLVADELKSYYEKRYPNGDGRLTKEELRGIYGGFRNGMGDGPRGTPTVDEGRVYVEGGNGHVSCLDAETGKTIWQVSLREDFGGRVPGWGYSESPLVVDNMVIVTPGGQGGTLAALNKENGKVIWRTDGVTEGAHYSSPVVAEIHGRPQIVQFARQSVFGVRLEDGQKLWSYSGANNGTANCATAIVHENHVFASSGYGTGGGLCKIVRDGEAFRAEEVYFDKKMANHHGGIVRIGDQMYGFGSGGLICMDYFTGEHRWTERSVGKGSLLAGDGLLFLLGEGHQLGLAAANPEEYEELGRIKLPPHGRPSWAHPALAGGVLYIRDQQSLTAFQVGK